MSESIKNQKAEAYEQFITTTPQDVLEHSIAYITFLADEFLKDDIKEDYDYMTSALFSELVTQHRIGASPAQDVCPLNFLPGVGFSKIR